MLKRLALKLEKVIEKLNMFMKKWDLNYLISEKKYYENEDGYVLVKEVSV